MVQITHVEQLYNVEFRDEGYCCCDTAHELVNCAENITKLSFNNCTAECRPYFVLHFQACPTVATCYVTKTTNFTVLVVDPNSVLRESSLLIQIPFNQSELETYSQVSTHTSIMLETTQIQATCKIHSQGGYSNIIRSFLSATCVCVCVCFIEPHYIQKCHQGNE